MTDRELMQEALYALTYVGDAKEIYSDTIESLRARLAQPEQEIEPDRDHVEDDGCPTEKAVLQRFWREHQKQEPVATLFGSLPVYDVPPKQEPVAWMHNFIDENVIAHRPADLDRHPDRWTPLYKDPTPCQTCKSLARTVMMDQTYHDSVMAQREWQGMTDEEINTAAYNNHPLDGIRAFARAIEAKLKEKNHAI